MIFDGGGEMMVDWSKIMNEGRVQIVMTPRRLADTLWHCVYLRQSHHHMHRQCHARAWRRQDL